MLEGHIIEMLLPYGGDEQSKRITGRSRYAPAIRSKPLSCVQARLRWLFSFSWCVTGLGRNLFCQPLRPTRIVGFSISDRGARQQHATSPSAFRQQTSSEPTQTQRPSKRHVVLLRGAISPTSRSLKHLAADGFRSRHVHLIRSSWCSRFMIAYLTKSLRLPRRCCDSCGMAASCTWPTMTSLLLMVNAEYCALPRISQARPLRSLTSTEAGQPFSRKQGLSEYTANHRIPLA